MRSGEIPAFRGCGYTFSTGQKNAGISPLPLRRASLAQGPIEMTPVETKETCAEIPLKTLIEPARDTGEPGDLLSPNSSIIMPVVSIATAMTRAFPVLFGFPGKLCSGVFFTENADEGCGVGRWTTPTGKTL
jgi:hypothetical protein